MCPPPVQFNTNAVRTSFFLVDGYIKPGSLAGAHSVVVVEHDMGFVRSIADQVTVLHQGRVLAEGRLDELQVDPTVIEVYLGAGDAYH